MNHIQDVEYKKIIESIMEDKDFLKMEKIKHHNTNRIDHSLKVSYYSYVIGKMLHLNYEEIARGGLLHDFCLERTVDYDAFKDKVKLYTIGHPKVALKNATERFSLSPMEQDMIKAHMFPLDYNIPKYAESWIVNVVDTVVSCVEFGKKFQYQIVSAVNLSFLFLINYIK